MKFSEAIIVILIAIVSLSAIGFLWYYTNSSNVGFVSSSAKITYVKPEPLVLGAEAVSPENALTQNDIVRLYQELCLRQASTEEINKWLYLDKDNLVQYLESLQVTVERYHRRYLAGCLE